MLISKKRKREREKDWSKKKIEFKYAFVNMVFAQKCIILNVIEQYKRDYWLFHADHFHKKKLFELFVTEVSNNVLQQNNCLFFFIFRSTVINPFVVHLICMDRV